MRFLILRKTSTVIFYGAIGAVVALTPQWARADQLSDIKTRGTLICGTLGTVPPLSFQDTKTRATVGYDVDICNLIARELGVKPEVKIVSPAGRIAELSQGRLDIVTGTLSWTPERAKQVDFSLSYNATNTVVMVRASSGLRSLEQLKGKRIATQSASTSATAVRDKLPEAKLVTFEDVPQALLAFSQRRADGVVFNQVVLAKYMIESKESKDEFVYIARPPLFVDKHGVGVKKGESALLAFVNETLTKADKSGELTTIFDKWLGMNTEFKMVRDFKLTDMAY